jgi:osmotically-inducible protein OsmY
VEFILGAVGAGVWDRGVVKMSILSFRRKLDSAIIVEAAHQRLRGSPYFFLKSVRCQVDGGVLTLRGRVPLKPLKQFAELIVSRVEGVREVVNRIEVYDPQRMDVSAQAARNAG